VESQAWAAHPNGELRLAIATFVGRGYRVESLSDTSAVVIKSHRFSVARFFFLGWLYPLTRLGARDQRRRLWVGPGGQVSEMRLPSDPAQDPPSD